MGIQVLESLLVYMLNPTVAKVQVLQVGQSCRQNTRFTYLLIISSERETSTCLGTDRLPADLFDCGISPHAAGY